MSDIEERIPIDCRDELEATGYAVTAAPIGAFQESGAVLKPLHGRENHRSTYSDLFGLGEFPLHTDGAHWPVPPRYVVLSALNPGADVATRLFDSRELLEQFGRSTIANCIVRPRKSGGIKSLIRILPYIGEKVIFRWDRVFLEPACASSKEIWRDLDSFISRTKTTDIFLSEVGMTLVIDNWRMLHGRSRIGSSSANRQIYRTFLWQ